MKSREKKFKRKIKFFIRDQITTLAARITGKFKTFMPVAVGETAYLLRYSGRLVSLTGLETFEKENARMLC